jgi:hypothetical protein
MLRGHPICVITALVLGSNVAAAVDATVSAWAVVHRQPSGDRIEIRQPGVTTPTQSVDTGGAVLSMRRTPDATIIFVVKNAAGTMTSAWHPQRQAVTVIPLPTDLGIVDALQGLDGGWIGIARTQPTSLATSGCALVVAQPDGSGLHRLAVDLYGAADPVLLQDGRLVYTRWHGPTTDPSANGGLVALNPDGTNAMGLVDGPPGGALRAARGIPGTGSLVAIATSSPTSSTGVLVRCDPARGPGYADAVRPIASGDAGTGSFRSPWPLTDTACVAAWSATGQPPWHIVTVTAQHRTLLWADDADLDLPVSLAPQAAPLQRPSLVDWRVPHGWIYVQDLLAAGQLAALAPGTAAGLRVRTFRPETAADGSTRWTSVVLGTAPIATDGSMFAQVPARIPIAFDVVDSQGSVILGMQRWTTVQRGERVACLSCHAAPTQVPRHGGAVAFRLPPTEMPPPSNLIAAAPGQEDWIRAERQRVQDLILTLLGGP